MNSLAHALERNIPAFAVPFTSEVDDNTILDVLGHADVAEFRADYFQELNRTNTVLQAERITALLPLLVTIRMQAEAGGNGGWIGSEQDRLDLFKALDPVANGFDIELEADILSDVIGLAAAASKPVIASSHDFNGTPSTSELEERAGRAHAAGANYFKLAAKINNSTEYDRLGEFLCNYTGIGLIVVGMGEEFGPRSRIEFPGLGSRLTYSAGPSTATASGQIDFVQMHQALCRAYPTYDNLYKYRA